MIQILNRVIAVIAVIFLFVLFTNGEAQEQNPPGTLVKEARCFLTEWLVKRDLERAMDHVSKTPILGICARPPYLMDKSKPTYEENHAAIKTILKRINDLVSSKPDLIGMIAPTQSVPTNENIANNEHFELFSAPKDFSNARFLCKFDDDTEFRRAFANPDIWYLAFTIESSESPDLSWIISWRKERNWWRVFSLSPLED